MIMKNGWSKTQVVAAEVGRGAPLVLGLPSTYQMIKFGDQSTAKVWKPLPNGWPLGECSRRRCPRRRSSPGRGCVPCTMFGSRPMFSMMSISPSLGQLPPPSIQKAGQMPWPLRDLDPGLETAVRLGEGLPAVSSRADVYWQVP